MMARLRTILRAPQARPALPVLANAPPLFGLEFKPAAIALTLPAIA